MLITFSARLKYFMDNHDVISSLFYSYYFSHGKSNP